MLRIYIFIIISTLFSIQYANAQTELKVWYTAKYPYAYTDSLGQLKGLDIDLIKKFSQYLSKKENKKYITNFTEYSNIKHINSISHQLDSGDIILPDYYQEIDSSNFLKTNVFRSNPYLAISNKGFKPIEVFKNNNLYLLFQKRTIILSDSAAMKKWRAKWMSYCDSSTKFIVNRNADTLFELIKSQSKFLMYLEALRYSKINGQIENFITIHPMLNYTENEATFILPRHSKFKDLFNFFLDKKTGYLSTNNYSLLYKQYFPNE